MTGEGRKGQGKLFALKAFHFLFRCLYYFVKKKINYLRIHGHRQWYGEAEGRGGAEAGWRGAKGNK